MPELPDLAILADAIDASLAGRRLVGTAIHEPLVVRGTTSEVEALTGQLLQSVTRRGKFLTFAFERDRIVINAMLTGRLGLASPGAKRWPKVALVFTFDSRVDVPQGAQRGWLADADWLPPPDEAVELRYRDATRMGKVYILPAGIDRPIAGWEEQGPDIDDPALTLDEWRRRIARHTGEIKRVLRNQAFVAGIGNAYSDEILWHARLAPNRTRASLASTEIDALYASAREVIDWAIGELRERVPPRLEVEQRGFLRVHGKGGGPCVRCGTRITELGAGGSITNWCRGCQR